MHEPPQAAYIHVPFCHHHCGYCNFSVIADRRDLESAFLDALERELRMLRAAQPMQTLFVGGGTPTRLSLTGLERLCQLLDEMLPRETGHETTFEANPEDVQPPLVALLQAHGVNRLSLGVQSFSSEKLQALDRCHVPEDVTRAVELARQGFPRVSLDLMFAAPGESLAAWRADLAAARAVGPQHLSTYGLTIEKGTRFWGQRQRGRLREVAESLQAQMYEDAIDTLTAAGYEHYEVSNFAQPGHRCRHNETYWRCQPYLAFGPGAARFIEGRRETNHRSTTTYMRRLLAGQSPVAEIDVITSEDAAREKLVFGLRRLEGIDRWAFQVETGWTVEQLAGPVVEGFVEWGLLEECDGRLRLTRAGLLVSDSLWPDLIVGGSSLP